MDLVSLIPTDLFPVLLAAGAFDPTALSLLKILACAGLVAAIFGRIGISPIPGYLIVGAIIGPHAVGLIDDPERVDGIAELAIVLLMFGLGLHMDPRQVRRGAGPILAIGLASTALSTLLIWPAAMAFGLSAPAALAVAMALSLSSTAVVLRIVQSRRELQRGYGRLSFGVLLMQDIIVIGMLAAIPFLARWAGVAEEVKADGGGWARDILMFGLAASALIGAKFALPPAMSWLARQVGPDVMLVVAAAVALLSAGAAGLAGLSPALGSFVAGFVLAGTPFRFQVSGQVTPLRDLFMAVFFVTVGLGLDVAALLPMAWALPIALLLLLGLKTVSIGVTSWLFGMQGRTVTQAAVTLSQSGEFSLVVVRACQAAGLLASSQATGVAGVVVLSLVLTPWLMALGRQLRGPLANLPAAPWSRSDAAPLDAESAASDAEREVVVAGYGPVGRAVVERLCEQGAQVTVIELNAATVRRQTALGRRVIYGDVTNPEVLEEAGVPHAEAVVLTIPDEEATLRACQVIRSLAPHAYVAARAHVLSRGLLAKELGADHVVVEEIATAAHMAEQVIEHLDQRRGAVVPEGPATMTELMDVRPGSEQRQ